MATYITLANYTQQGLQNIKDAPLRMEAARALAKEHGAELKAVYLTMGQYDLVSITEAPNDEVVCKLILTIAGAGNISTCTLRAFDEGEFADIVAGLG